MITGGKVRPRFNNPKADVVGYIFNKFNKTQKDELTCSDRRALRLSKLKKRAKVANVVLGAGMAGVALSEMALVLSLVGVVASDNIKDFRHLQLNEKALNDDECQSAITLEKRRLADAFCRGEMSYDEFLQACEDVNVLGYLEQSQDDEIVDLFDKYRRAQAAKDKSINSLQGSIKSVFGCSAVAGVAEIIRGKSEEQAKELGQQMALEFID